MTAMSRALAPSSLIVVGVGRRISRRVEESSGRASRALRVLAITGLGLVNVLVESRRVSSSMHGGVRLRGRVGVLLDVMTLARVLRRRPTRPEEELHGRGRVGGSSSRTSRSRIHVHLPRRRVRVRVRMHHVVGTGVHGRVDLDETAGGRGRAAQVMGASQVDEAGQGLGAGRRKSVSRGWIAAGTNGTRSDGRARARRRGAGRGHRRCCRGSRHLGVLVGNGVVGADVFVVAVAVRLGTTAAATAVAFVAAREAVAAEVRQNIRHVLVRQGHGRLDAQRVPAVVPHWVDRGAVVSAKQRRKRRTDAGRGRPTARGAAVVVIHLHHCQGCLDARALRRLFLHGVEVGVRRTADGAARLGETSDGILLLLLAAVVVVSVHLVVIDILLLLNLPKVAPIVVDLVVAVRVLISVVPMPASTSTTTAALSPNHVATAPSPGRRRRGLDSLGALGGRAATTRLVGCETPSCPALALTEAAATASGRRQARVQVVGQCISRGHGHVLLRAATAGALLPPGLEVLIVATGPRRDVAFVVGGADVLHVEPDLLRVHARVVREVEAQELLVGRRVALVIVAPGNEGLDALTGQGLGHVVEPPVFFTHAVAAAAAAAAAARVGRRQGARGARRQGRKRGREARRVGEEVGVVLHVGGGDDVGREAGHARRRGSRDGRGRRRRGSRGHGGSSGDGVVGGVGAGNVHGA